MRNFEFFRVLGVMGAFGLVALATAGCKGDPPKAGDTCSAGRAACQDPKTELVCDDGKFFAAPCKGASGCATAGDTVTCDISGNAEGDVCPKSGEDDSACTADKKSRVSCNGGKYHVEPCRGPDGCKASGGTVECDNSLRDVGDPCDKDDENDYWCSPDKKASVKCKAGKIILDEKCSGPKGCDSSGPKVVCDRGPQKEGDPCNTEPDYECATDGVTRLACKEGKWAVDKKCSTKCVSSADDATCDGEE
ncbi:MAG: hypothetical protein R3B70_37510 [Polyangiaceae bacterium]